MAGNKTFVPRETIVVLREGARVRPPIGKPFVFTEEEYKHIQNVSPNALRLPVNEEAAKLTNKNENGKTDDQIERQTAEIVAKLVAGNDGNPPNMETVNAALKDAELPKILAADRDAIIEKMNADPEL